MQLLKYIASTSVWRFGCVSKGQEFNPRGKLCLVSQEVLGLDRTGILNVGLKDLINRVLCFMVGVANTKKVWVFGLLLGLSYTGYHYCSWSRLARQLWPSLQKHSQALHGLCFPAGKCFKLNSSTAERPFKLI